MAQTLVEIALSIVTENHSKTFAKLKNKETTYFQTEKV